MLYGWKFNFVNNITPTQAEQWETYRNRLILALFRVKLLNISSLQLL